MGRTTSSDRASSPPPPYNTPTPYPEYPRPSLEQPRTETSPIRWPSYTDATDDVEAWSSEPLRRPAQPQWRVPSPTSQTRAHGEMTTSGADPRDTWDARCAVCVNMVPPERPQPRTRARFRCPSRTVFCGMMGVPLLIAFMVFLIGLATGATTYWFAYAVVGWVFVLMALWPMTVLCGERGTDEEDGCWCVDAENPTLQYRSLDWNAFDDAAK